MRVLEMTRGVVRDAQLERMSWFDARLAQHFRDVAHAFGKRAGIIFERISFEESCVLLE